MILKFLLYNSHLQGEFRDSLFKDPEVSWECELSWPGGCCLLQNHFSLRWGYEGNGTALNLQSIPECATLKINLIHPFPPPSFFSFLRSRKNWAHKLKCPLRCPNLCNQHSLKGTRVLGTLTSPGSNFQPDELFAHHYFNILNSHWLFFDFKDGEGCLVFVWI